MTRYVACLAVTLLVGAHLRAGELDGEFTPGASSAPALQKSPAAPAKAATTRETGAGVVKASELDDEAPADASRRGGWGGGRGGWGGGWRGGWGGGWRGGWGGWGGGWRGGWGVGWWGGWRGGWWGPGFGYASWPVYPYYYPTYVSYGYAAYPRWGFCW